MSWNSEPAGRLGVRSRPPRPGFRRRSRGNGRGCAMGSPGLASYLSSQTRSRLANRTRSSVRRARSIAVEPDGLEGVVGQEEEDGRDEAGRVLGRRRRNSRRTCPRAGRSGRLVQDRRRPGASRVRSPTLRTSVPRKWPEPCCVIAAVRSLSETTLNRVFPDVSGLVREPDVDRNEVGDPADLAVDARPSGPG